MLIFSDTADSRIAGLPPPYQAPTLSAIHTLLEISNPESEGFVAFIEAEDTPESVIKVFVRAITSIESAFRDGHCLVGVLLWGNSGDGVTIICPDEVGYAPEIANILKQHL